MTLIKTVKGRKPCFGENIYLADNATIIGEVTMGDNCSVWFSSVIRGDVNSIKIGNNVNIQDGAIIHCTYQKSNTILGDNITVGHNAIIHGCEIRDNVVVGMGAIIMDGALIESNSIVGAGSVVLEGTHIKSGVIYAGNPAIKVKDLNQLQISKLIKGIADNYVLYSSWFKD